jgi:pimeloyl-ACP methyl ester carboxylesterase
MARPRLRRLLLAQALSRADRLTPAQAARFVRDAATCPIYFPLLKAVLREGPPSGLDCVSCPVLFAWGTRDWITPARRYSRRLRALVPAAAWYDLPRLGHVPMADDPDLVARLIVQFATSSNDTRERSIAP